MKRAVDIETELILYRLREHAHARGVTVGNIQTIGQRIEVLKQRNATAAMPEGFTTAEEVLEDARDPESPLHICFTWDESEAARLYNLREARGLVNCYEVRIVSRNHEPIVICPANVTVGRPGERRILGTAFAMSDETYREQVLDESICQLSGIQSRLTKLNNINPQLVAILDEVVDMIVKEKRARPKAKERRPVAVR